MKRISVPVLVGMCAVALTAAGGLAQERSLRDNLADLNERLRDNGYTDEDQQTYTQMSIRGDRLVAEIIRIRGEAKTTNVYDAAIADLDPARIRVRAIGPYIELGIPARGTVTVKLRCQTGPITNAWDMPAGSAVLLEVRPDRDLAEALRAALASVVRQAKEEIAAE